MAFRSISRCRAHNTAWIRIWDDRPPICSLPHSSGPYPTFDASTGTFQPWDWVRDPDWVDFGTPWRPFIPVAPPPALHFTSDLFWVYASNASSSVNPEYLADGRWRVPSDVTGSYARAKIWLESQVQFVRTAGGVGLPPPPPMHSAIMFSTLRADDPEALRAAVWPYRRDLLDWFGYFIWALAGIPGQWFTLPAMQANVEFVDFATRYLVGATPRGVSIRTDDFPTWPAMWHSVFRRWLDLGVPINYPWSAAHAEDRRWLQLRPTAYPSSWHRVDCSVPRQTAILAPNIHATSGYKAWKHKESKSWHAALHFSDYSNADDFVNLRVYYRDAIHDDDADIFEPDDDDDEQPPGGYDARRFNFSSFRHRLRDSPGLARWRDRHPAARSPPHSASATHLEAGPSMSSTAYQTQDQTPTTTSALPAMASITHAAEPDDDLVSLGSGEGHDPAMPGMDTIAPPSTSDTAITPPAAPVPIPSPPPTQTDAAYASEATPAAALQPLTEGNEPAHEGATHEGPVSQDNDAEPDPEGATHAGQAMQDNDAGPDPVGATHAGQVSQEDIDMEAPDEQGPAPNNVFSTFWAGVTTGHPGLAAVYQVAPNVSFGIDGQFFTVMTVTIPPTTEARLAQALERNPTAVPAELVRLMLRLGMRFHVSWPPAWGAAWAHLRRNGDGPLPLPTYLANAPAPLGPPSMAFHELCAAYLLRADDLFRRPCNGRLLRYGGIIWRLALHYGGVDLSDAVLDGPSSSYAFHGWFFTAPDGNHCDNPIAWQDDPVIPEALGTSPYSSAPTLWPDPDVWERSGRWSGRWNAFAETWFTSRVAEIQDHTARPLTPRKWRENLRGINQGIRDNTRVRLQLSAVLPGLRTTATSYLATSPLSHQGRLQLLTAPAPP